MEVRGAPQLLLLLLVHRGGGAGEGGGEGVPRPQVCGDCLILGRHLGHRALAAATGLCTLHREEREYWCLTHSVMVGSWIVAVRMAPRSAATACCSETTVVTRLAGPWPSVEEAEVGGRLERTRLLANKMLLRRQMWRRWGKWGRCSTRRTLARLRSRGG